MFCNRQRAKVKILAWVRSGFVLWYKRLERERFKWPGTNCDDVMTLSGQQLNWLLKGRMQPHKSLFCGSVG